MRSEIARPAASSLALLMRRPDESRWIAVARSFCVLSVLYCAVNEVMFVLIVCMEALRCSAVRTRGPGAEILKSPVSRQGLDKSSIRGAFRCRERTKGRARHCQVGPFQRTPAGVAAGR